MKAIQRLATWGGLPFCLLAAQTAWADTVTFTFRVPVEFSELHPDVDSVEVRCHFYNPGASGPIAGQPFSPVTSDRLPVDASGSVSTVVEMTRNVAVRDVFRHDHYRCQTFLYSKDGKRERAVRRAEHPAGGAHPSNLPFHVVQDSSQIEIEGKRVPEVNRPLGAAERGVMR